MGGREEGTREWDPDDDPLRIQYSRRAQEKQGGENYT